MENSSKHAGIFFSWPCSKSIQFVLATRAYVDSICDVCCSWSRLLSNDDYKGMSPAPGRTMMRNDSRVARPVLENHRHPPPSSARARMGPGRRGSAGARNRVQQSMAFHNSEVRPPAFPPGPDCLLLCSFGFCSILLCCCCRGFVFMAQLGTDAILWYAIASASPGFVVLKAKCISNILN